MKSNEKFCNKKHEMLGKISQIIARDGYENITVRGICKELEISIGTFYHYFPEKTDLVAALFEHIDNYFYYDIATKFSDDEVDNLILYCNSYADYVTNNGVETCRCISVSPLTVKDHKYLDENRYMFSVLRGILSRGIDKGQFSQANTPDEMTRMLLVLLRGYSADWAKRNGSYDLVSSINSFINLFIKSLVDR